MNRGTERTHCLLGKIQRKRLEVRPKAKFLLAILAAKAVSGNGLFSPPPFPFVRRPGAKNRQGPRGRGSGEKEELGGGGGPLVDGQVSSSSSSIFPLLLIPSKQSPGDSFSVRRWRMEGDRGLGITNVRNDHGKC